MSTADKLPEEATPWICPSCGASASSPYCSACGERRWNERDLSLRHLVEPLLEGLIHFDSRLLRTARTLVAAPGRLTTAYLEGQHRPFVAPFHIFLVANVVFFLAQTFSGLGIFTTPLSAQIQDQIYSPLVARWTTSHLAAKGLTLSQYAPIYAHAESLYAKTLVMVMLPLFAVATGLLFVDRRRVAVANLVFAVHFYAFLLIFLSALFPSLLLALLLTVRLRHYLGMVLDANALDLIVTGIEGTVCAVYLAKAVATVYGSGPLRRWLSAGVLTVAALYILYAYRFVLFVVTLTTT